MPSSIFHHSSSLAIVSLGSNLGDSRKNILDAMARLRKLSSKPILKSSLWRTSPVDCPPGSPEFINAVVGFAPKKTETPKSLLKKLQKLEKEFGRTRKKVLNEPRTLDLDLIAFGEKLCDTPDLTLPHPRAHLRRFVLEPLFEIAPDLVLPGQGKSVAQLLTGLFFDEALVKLD